MEYEKKYKEAQKWMESIYSELSHEQQMEAEAFFPELAESKDERVRKEIIEAFKNLGDGKIPVDINYADIFTWLEKQGEQKPNYCHHEVDLSGCSEEYKKAYYDGWNNCNMQHSQCKSELDDVLKCLINGMKFYYEDNKDATWGTDKWSMPVKHIIEVLEKQGEQKPVDKVEPKFHEGDWIIRNNNKYIYQVVVEVKRGIYVVRDNADNREYCVGIESADRDGRLWNISDAKDGDVLACPLPKGCESGEQIFIFKGINSRIYVDNCIEFYCRVHEGVFYENENNYGYMGTTSSPIYPATKEQRETLIKAMTDAGYTFDFENKELKKIAPLNKELEGKV